ncbi:hypothetical protein MnTg02_01720 [bacterium MnTg02]|nr:hypothetical protein MnTg02_01720 [bacterium MnTg02]
MSLRLRVVFVWRECADAGVIVWQKWALTVHNVPDHNYFVLVDSLSGKNMPQHLLIPVAKAVLILIESDNRSISSFKQDASEKPVSTSGSIPRASFGGSCSKLDLPPHIPAQSHKSGRS